MFLLKLSVHGKKTQNKIKQKQKKKSYNLHPYYVLIHLLLITIVPADSCYTVPTISSQCY